MYKGCFYFDPRCLLSVMPHKKQDKFCVCVNLLGTSWFPFSLTVVEKWNTSRGRKTFMGTPWGSFPLWEKKILHFWSASLVSLVTNLQASGSLGSSLLWVALAPWPVKKPTQRLILWATKGQMKPQLDCSWRDRIPTTFRGALGKCLEK